MLKGTHSGRPALLWILLLLVALLATQCTTTPTGPAAPAPAAPAAPAAAQPTAAAAAPAAPAATAPAAAATGGTLKIGLQAPMTGDNAQYGEVMRKGVAEAIDEINAAGGVNGLKLELVVGDDKATPAEAVSVVQRMLTLDKVAAVIGGFNSSPTLAAMPATQQAKTIHFTMGASPKLTEAGDPYMFRAILTDAPMTADLVNYATKDMGLKKIAVMKENTDYGVSLSDLFKSQVEANGAQVVTVESYNPGDKDFTAQLSKIKSLNPDAIMVAGLYNEAGLIAQQAKRLGLQTKFLGSDGVSSPALVQVGGDAVEGFTFVSAFDPNYQDPKVQAFVKNYQAKYNEKPEAYSAISYDAMQVVADAIKRAGIKSADLTDADREALQKAMAASNYQGVTGPFKFDQKGDLTKGLFIQDVKNGQFETVRPPK
jgi:branched-chain amino acid transport system substrate-binding protein